LIGLDIEELFEGDDDIMEWLRKNLKFDGVLRHEIRTLIENRSGGWKNNHLMLHKYLHDAELSLQKSSVGNRYQGPLLNLKKISAYIFLKGGAYNTLYQNSLMPSESTIKTDIVNRKKLEIGKFYIKEFKEFMIERGFDEKIIVISEDGSGIIKEVVYDPDTDELVGLIPELDVAIGLPKPNYFKATSPSKVIEFLQKFKIAPYLEVIVGKPLKIGR
jgi:hypothetical protein